MKASLSSWQRRGAPGRFFSLVCLTALLLTVFIASNGFAQSPHTHDADTSHGHAISMHLRVVRHALPQIGLFKRSHRKASSESFDHVLHQVWDGSDWLDVQQVLITFDAQGNVTSEAVQFNDNGTWVNSIRALSMYTDGLLASLTDQEWNEGDWQTRSRDSFFYDTDGEYILSLFEEYLEGTWQPTSRFRLISDDGTTQEWLEENYDSTDGSWVAGDAREFITHTEDGYIQEFQSRLNAASVWEKRSRITTYKSAVFETIFAPMGVIEATAFFPDFLSEIWDDDASDWVAESRVTSALNAANLPEIQLAEDWRRNDAAWIPRGRGLFAYDADRVTARTEQRWIENTGTWDNRDRYLFMYNSPTASEHSAELPARDQLTSVYPNPFHGTTTLVFTVESPVYAVVKVYDLLGRNVATLAEGVRAAGEHRLTFDPGTLPVGVYVARLQIDGHAPQTHTLVFTR